jgi:uncharacterized protein (DUF1330 family)
MRWSPIGSHARRWTIPISTRSTPAWYQASSARGGKFQILEGPEKFHRFVVIEFPSFEQAVACHESPEYLEAAAHRKKDDAGELEIVIVESI